MLAKKAKQLSKKFTKKPAKKAVKPAKRAAKPVKKAVHKKTRRSAPRVTKLDTVRPVEAVMTDVKPSKRKSKVIAA